MTDHVPAMGAPIPKPQRVDWDAKLAEAAVLKIDDRFTRHGCESAIIMTGGAVPSRNSVQGVAKKRKESKWT